MTAPLPPLPGAKGGLATLGTLKSGKGILVALQSLHAELGDVFRLPMPGGTPVVLAGPEAGHFVSVTARHALAWRNERDPVARLLRHGLLVEDRESHDTLRRLVMPSLHRRRVADYAAIMLRRTEQIANGWDLSRPLDMLVEMRRIALLILVETLFEDDFTPHLISLFPAILRVLEYISPGLWLLWPELPRPGYGWAIRQIDAYLYDLIARRRAHGLGSDLVSALIAGGLDDDRIRDQLLTLFIAGHDTSTALLAWTLYHLGLFPDLQEQIFVEQEAVLGLQPPDAENVERLTFLGQVIDETLRLYPPIHVGNRVALEDLEFQGYRIPAGSRVMYSIYLTHRHPSYWPDPDRFDPGRFAPEVRHPPYTFVPFGGGPRNCIGAFFAQVEARIVLTYLIRRFRFVLLEPQVHMHMGATLEPRPGVRMRVMPR